MEIEDLSKLHVAMMGTHLATADTPRGKVDISLSFDGDLLFILDKSHYRAKMGSIIDEVFKFHDNPPPEDGKVDCSTCQGAGDCPDCNGCGWLHVIEEEAK
jgi:hypothetical protein